MYNFCQEAILNISYFSAKRVIIHTATNIFKNKTLMSEIKICKRRDFRIKNCLIQPNSFKITMIIR